MGNMDSAKKKKTFFDLFTTLILLFAVFSIAMLSPLDIFTKAGKIGTDSAVYRYIGWEMTRGKIPYRDFFDNKGPMVFFINYIGTMVSRIRGVWVIEIVFIFTTVFVLYKIGRRTLNRRCALFVILMTLAPMNIYFEGGNLSEEYALPFQFISVYIFLDFFSNPSKYIKRDRKNSFLNLGNKLPDFNVFLCGFCFAGVLLLRVNMISLWMVFCISILIYCIKEKEYGSFCRFVLIFLFGSFVLIVPTLMYFFKNQAFAALIDDYIVFNIKYCSVTDTISKTDAFVFFGNSFPTILSLVIMGYKIKCRWGNNESVFFDCSYFIYILLTLVFLSISGYQFPHYGMTLCPAYSYPFIIIVETVTKKEVKKIMLDVTIIAYITITFVVPNWTVVFQNTIYDIYNGTNTKKSNMYSDKIVSYIIKNTMPDDKITVYGNRNMYYLYSERGSVSKYSYQHPLGSVDSGFLDKYFMELENTPPKIVVWVHNQNDTRMLNYLNRYEYSLVIEGDVLVYQRL